MASYHVITTGHIIEMFRPLELPPKIHQVHNYDVESVKDLINLASARVNDILGGNGMLVRLDPFNVKIGKIDMQRRWVPLHMISYISQAAIPMVGELPYIDEQGNLVVKSGKAIILQ